MEEKSINEERNDEVEKNQFLKSFDEIFENFFKILDFNELDVNRFLSFKDSKKKYGFYIMNRILIIILEYSLPMFPMIIGIVYPSLFGNLFLTLLIITVIIIFPVSISIFFMRKFFDKKYDYSMAIYHKEKKKMNKYCKQLNLIINNRHLIEELGEINYNNNYKNKIKRINNRVDYYSQLFKSLNHYFIQFGFISLVFSLSPLFFDIIYKLIQNQVISTDTLRTSVGFTLIFLVYFWRSYKIINLYMIEDLYDKKKKITEEEPFLYWLLSDKLKSVTEELENKEFGKTRRIKLFNIISNLMKNILRYSTMPSNLKDPIKKHEKRFKREIKKLKSFDSVELLKLQCSYEHDACRFILFEKYLVSSAGIEILGESKNIIDDEEAVFKIRDDLVKLI